MAEQTAQIIAAVNAYADAQAQHPTDRAWLALVHRSNRSAEAVAARAIQAAGLAALDAAQDWAEIEKREDGACVLQAPDGTQVLYHCERHDGRTIERLTLLATESAPQVQLDDNGDSEPFVVGEDSIYFHQDAENPELTVVAHSETGEPYSRTSDYIRFASLDEATQFLRAAQAAGALPHGWQ